MKIACQEVVALSMVPLMGISVFFVSNLVYSYYFRLEHGNTILPTYLYGKNNQKNQYMFTLEPSLAKRSDIQCLQRNNTSRMIACSCPKSWIGLTCEKYFKCDPHPCQHGGSCIKEKKSHDYKCVCIDGITGPNCETNLNDCVNNTCQNGGTCVDLINGYSCNCSNWWYGANCELNVNDCASNPCAEGATCEDRLSGKYTCVCPYGKVGTHCNVDETCFMDKKISRAYNKRKLDEDATAIYVVLNVYLDHICVLKESRSMCFAELFEEDNKKPTISVSLNIKSCEKYHTVAYIEKWNSFVIMGQKEFSVFQLETQKLTNHYDIIKHIIINTPNMKPPSDWGPLYFFDMSAQESHVIFTDCRFQQVLLYNGNGTNFRIGQFKGVGRNTLKSGYKYPCGPLIKQICTILIQNEFYYHDGTNVKV